MLSSSLPHGTPRDPPGAHTQSCRGYRDRQEPVTTSRRSAPRLRGCATARACPSSWSRRFVISFDAAGWRAASRAFVAPAVDSTASWPSHARGARCPSCGGRRMAERAAHLVDRVLPDVPRGLLAPGIGRDIVIQPAMRAEPTVYERLDRRQHFFGVERRQGPRSGRTTLTERALGTLCDERRRPELRAGGEISRWGRASPHRRRCP